MAITTQQSTSTVVGHDESILVVKRAYLIDEPDGWHGLRTENLDHYIAIVNAKKEFMPRSLAEQDDRYKQIIPYLVFMHDNHIFVMQRHANASEQRLQNKYTIGIGGHIRQEDIKTHDIYAWANREFHEEVWYEDAMSIEPLGLLNDDTNNVGRVHIGFVFLLHGNSNRISVKSELKYGTFMSITECYTILSQFESWSQIVLHRLQARMEQ
jgi:predicted NUDIX family phosphoesterase